MNRNQYELYHYGVKGMKWGVRHDYKLKGRERSGDKLVKRKQKAQKYYDRANEKQKQIDTLYKERDSSSFIKKAKINKDIKRLERKKDRDIKDAQAKEQGKLTRKQKAIAIGATVVAAYATYKFIDSGHASQMIAKGKAALGHTDIDFKKNANLSRKGMSSDEIMSSVVKRINPNYGNIGTKNNCRRCTFAYEMSRRGYDVRATTTIGGTGQADNGLYNALTKGKKLGTGSYLSILLMDDDHGLTRGAYEKVNDLYDKTQTIREATTEKIFSSLSEQPNGSRGELAVEFSIKNLLLSRHSVAYEIIDNKPVIFDCQTGTAYKTAEELRKLTVQNGIDLLSGASFIRLDDKELDMDFLTRWLKNA